MNLIISDTAEEMARRVADGVGTYMSFRANPLFCPASGDTPAALYREMQARAKDNRLDVTNWHFIGLDEWVGMNGADEGSCRYYLDRDLFHPLRIRKERICFFDGRADDPAAECARGESFMKELGGIDVAILGIGTNGHIAMNEPGTSPDVRCHISVLHPSTQATGQKYFSSYQPLTYGITLGLGDLLEARHLYLLAIGEHKAAIVQKALEGPVSEVLPASLLRAHPSLHVYLDRAAAGELSINKM